MGFGARRAMLGGVSDFVPGFTAGKQGVGPEWRARAKETALDNKS